MRPDCTKPGGGRPRDYNASPQIFPRTVLANRRQVLRRTRIGIETNLDRDPLLPRPADHDQAPCPADLSHLHFSEDVILVSFVNWKTNSCRTLSVSVLAARSTAFTSP